MKVITDSKQGDILNQYITFTKICDEQRKLHGRTGEAVNEIIRICMDQNVLKKYLASCEREVKSIMIALFNDEEIMKSFWKSERYAMKEEGKAEGRAEGRAEGKAEGRAEGLLATIKNLMANMNKTAGEAMSLMGIPENERAMYTQLLQSSAESGV